MSDIIQKLKELYEARDYSFRTHTNPNDATDTVVDVYFTHYHPHGDPDEFDYGTHEDMDSAVRAVWAQETLNELQGKLSIVGFPTAQDLVDGISERLTMDFSGTRHLTSVPFDETITVYPIDWKTYDIDGQFDEPMMLRQARKNAFHTDKQGALHHAANNDPDSYIMVWLNNNMKCHVLQGANAGGVIDIVADIQMYPDVTQLLAQEIGKRSLAQD